MKKILLGLSVLAAAAATSTGAMAAKACYDFSAAGYCDAMQYDSGRKATWIRWDCTNSSKQTKASYRKGTTSCTGASGCDPSATYGWDSLDWKFNKTASTGDLTGVYQGTQYQLQVGMPIAISTGACAANGTRGGKPSMARH